MLVAAVTVEVSFISAFPLPHSTRRFSSQILALGGPTEMHFLKQELWQCFCSYRGTTCSGSVFGVGI